MDAARAVPLMALEYGLLTWLLWWLRVRLVNRIRREEPSREAAEYLAIAYCLLVGVILALQINDPFGYKVAVVHCPRFGLKPSSFRRMSRASARNDGFILSLPKSETGEAVRSRISGGTG